MRRARLTAPARRAECECRSRAGSLLRLRLSPRSMHRSRAARLPPKPSHSPPLGHAPASLLFPRKRGCVAPFFRASPCDTAGSRATRPQAGAFATLGETPPEPACPNRSPGAAIPALLGACARFPPAAGCPPPAAGVSALPRARGESVARALLSRFPAPFFLFTGYQ